ncbi:MAG: type VI secretion system contractile sheath large subunit [Myxococcales bacterium]|nr:type VI secretion system contractile sheath large subunit [Myxococcales bacterium]
MPTPSLDEIAEASEASLLEQVMELSGHELGTPSYELIQRGLAGFLGVIVKNNGTASDVDAPGVDLIISELTSKMCRQIDEILHHPVFQGLEASWRGLKFVVDRVDFRENIRVEMLNVSKAELLEDFQDSPEIPQCGLFRVMYSAEYGQFGGRPFGLVVGNYEFTPTPRDMYLIDACASVATMAHAPFVAGASPAFFGLENWLTLPQLDELEALFAGPQYTKWRAFRENDDARYVGLCLPRFLLRLPYGARSNRVPEFEYEEDVTGHHERYLWGNAAFAFATRVADSFARYRWSLHIIGPNSGGTVEDLPLHEYEALGRIQTKIPTEIVITERREVEIARQGFIPFCYRRDTENACFFSAHSCQLPKTFGISEEGRKAELNHRLSTQLPYLLMTCRLAHYIKVMQRENIGSWKERQDLNRELNRWLNQYVSNAEKVTAAIRARRPLRSGEVVVSDVKGNAGWYRIDLKIQPHFRFMGASFELGLVGRLDQE